MEQPPGVNSQITDAVTQPGVTVLANASTTAMGTLYASMAQSTGILNQNAVMAQQQTAISSQAATNMGVIQVFATDTLAAAATVSKIKNINNPDNLLAFLSALTAPRNY